MFLVIQKYIEKNIWSDKSDLIFYSSILELRNLKYLDHW